MQRFSRAGLVSVAICATLAVASAPAVGALPELLPGATGTHFTGKTGKGTLQIKGGASVTCSSSTGEGELINTTTGTGSLDFKGCTVAGLPINSLGDASGTVLLTGEASVCYISKAAKTVGVVTRLPSGGAHLEIPSTKLLLVKKGAFILQASPVNMSTTTYTGVLEQKGGKQAIEKCEGGAKETLSVSTDAGEFVEAGLEIKEDVLTFSTAQELMA